MSTVELAKSRTLRRGQKGRGTFKTYLFWEHTQNKKTALGKLWEHTQNKKHALGELWEYSQSKKHALVRLWEYSQSKKHALVRLWEYSQSKNPVLVRLWEYSQKSRKTKVEQVPAGARLYRVPFLQPSDSIMRLAVRNRLARRLFQMRE